MSSCHSPISCSDCWAEPNYKHLLVAMKKVTEYISNLTHGVCFALLTACETTGRLLGLCQPPVYRGMSRRSRRSSCPPASTHPWPPRPPFRMAGWTLTCAVKGEFKVEMDGHGVMTAAESMSFHITIIHYHGRKTQSVLTRSI